MIALFLPSVVLSSGLPDSFDIRQMDDPFDIYISLNGNVLYSTTLYPVDGKATFYGFRALVEQFLVSKRVASCKLEVNVRCVESQEDDQMLSEVLVIYSSVRPSYDDEFDFLSKHFLTTRSCMTVPCDAYIDFAFATDGHEQFQGYVEGIFLSNGEVIHGTGYADLTDRQEASLYRFIVSPRHIKEMIERHEKRDMGKLLSFTYHVEERSLTVFVTDETPLISFSFLNAFNVFEQIHIFGTLKEKTALDRKEANCNGKTAFYDVTRSHSYEIETAPLSIQEAQSFSQFFESPYIYHMLPPDKDEEVIILSDETEFSRSPSEPITLTFSFRFADGSHWIVPEQAATGFHRSFNSKFSETFK